jgi:hypothetical protein
MQRRVSVGVALVAVSALAPAQVLRAEPSADAVAQAVEGLLPLGLGSTGTDLAPQIEVVPCRICMQPAASGRDFDMTLKRM